MALFDFVKRRKLGRPMTAPKRDTVAYPNLVQIGRVNNYMGLVYKATPRNLRYFSRQPYPRRAINAIKNPIKMLEWEIMPIDGVDMNPELERQVEIVTNCFLHPNESDDFQSFVEQVIEDYLIGAGAIETQLGGDPSRPLLMWPVDGLSIQVHSDWDGKGSSKHYAQTIGYGSEFGGGEAVQLTDNELLYIRPNPNTATPFGYGALEIAFSTIARLLGVAEFAGNVAGNSLPTIGLDFPGVSSEELISLRNFWRNEVEGQGMTPMFGTRNGADGKTSGIEVLRFHPEGDTALYLKYQEVLIREIAAAFDLSPQNFGVERDVNRSTSEVSEDRDWDQAIKPCAHDISKNLTRHCINRLLGFSQLRFRFIGLDREDELATNQILAIRYKNNTVTPNEWRDRFGEDPMDSQWADMTAADVEVAMNAARNTEQVLDKDLPGAKPLPAKKPATIKPKPKG